MKKIFMATVLIALSGTALMAAPAEPAASVNEKQVKTTLDSSVLTGRSLTKNLQDYLTLIQLLPASFQNQLILLNKEKGWDPDIYAEIAQADKLLELANQQILALQKVIENPQSIEINLNRINAKILEIQASVPVPPANFPDRCGDAALATTYTNVKGVFDKATGGRGYSIKNQVGNTYSEVPVSSDAGVIGTGQPIFPGTLLGSNVTGWVTQTTINGKTVSGVVCVGKSQ